MKSSDCIAMDVRAVRMSVGEDWMIGFLYVVVCEDISGADGWWV